MPFGPTPARLMPGMRAFPAARFNQLSGLVGRLENLSGGRGFVRTPGGTFGYREGDGWRLGTTPSAGIPARGSGGLGSADITETFISRSGAGSATLTVGSNTFEGFNLSSKAVAGNALTVYGWIWGLWLCVWEDCTS